MKTSISFILTVLLVLTGIVGCNSRTKSAQPQEVSEVGFDDSADSKSMEAREVAFNDSADSQPMEESEDDFDDSADSLSMEESEVDIDPNDSTNEDSGISSLSQAFEKRSQVVGEAGLMETSRLSNMNQPETQAEINSEPLPKETNANSTPAPKGTNADSMPTLKGTTDADYVQWVVDMIDFYKTNMMKSLKLPDIDQVGVNPLSDIMGIMQTSAAVQDASQKYVVFAQLLNQLDVSKCPEDFRALYTEYARKNLVLADGMYKLFNEEVGFLDLYVIGLQDGYTKDLDKVEKEMYSLAKNKYGATIPEPYKPENK